MSEQHNLFETLLEERAAAIRVARNAAIRGVTRELVEAAPPPVDDAAAVFSELQDRMDTTLTENAGAGELTFLDPSFGTGGIAPAARTAGTGAMIGASGGILLVAAGAALVYFHVQRRRARPGAAGREGAGRRATSLGRRSRAPWTPTPSRRSTSTGGWR